MATLNVKFRPSTIDGKEGCIYYQIIHNRVVKRIKSKYKIESSEWDTKRSRIIVESNDPKRFTTLNIIRDRVKFEMKRLKLIIREMECDMVEYSIDDLLSVYGRVHKGVTLYNFLLDTSQRLKELGNIRTAETYLSLLNSFMTFQCGQDLAMLSLDRDVLERYEAFLKHRGSALNTISFYMRTMRAAYNRAVERGIVKEQNLFSRVHTSIEKTAKRAIPLALISKIKVLDLSHEPELEFARDIFLFSFYTRGMSFVDIAYLRKRDIKNGEVSYRRQKTGQRLNIKWERCMQELANKYMSDDTEYILPIIVNPDIDTRKQYIEAMGRVNRNLKRVAHLAGITTNVTTYVARHSWASAAKSKNIPISVISEALGHDNETTTQIYLASLDTDVIDRANMLIIRSV
ncbi:MAG: site-specific integrase [Rikenellaceae bacterium]